LLNGGCCWFAEKPYQTDRGLSPKRNTVLLMSYCSES
jgi:hypothetical protein